MNPTYDFNNQVALVTGASSGMGLATATAFAEAGASVVLADINREALRAATDQLTSAGHKAIGVTCDVADEAQVALLAERCARDGLLQTGSADFHSPEHPQFDRFRAFELYGHEPVLGPIVAG